ncbi:MAG: allantoinase AllB [Chloroflexi bacterium]|nr:MAG: allantoinase AllB [Chloroflexota bacterium]
MSDADLDVVIRAPRVISGDGEAPRSIGIRDGRIVAVAPVDAKLSASREVEFNAGDVVLPGIVDTHVHICEPGNADWEGFSTATKAAAAGGITTLVDMPIDSVPATVTVDGLEAKRASARDQCHVDVGFWGGAIPGNLPDMRPLRETGVLGFKCFLVDPGVPDFPPLDAREMDEVLAVTRDLNAPLLVHAESADVAAGMSPVNSRKYGDYLESRPKEMENLAVAQVIEAARRTGGRAHVVHLSSSDAVAMIASARREGVRVTAETCPHYLTLTAEEIPDGATAFKCSPPIREASNRDSLWGGLEQGVIDFIVSDHSPCTVAMKELASGNFGAAWGGISSVQLSLSIIWTGARRRRYSLATVAAWMSEGPARLAGLRRKGKIAPGFDADFCVLAPDESFVVDPARLYHRNPLTPYAGRRLMGVVRETWLRGEPIDLRFARGQLLDSGATAAAHPIP